MGFRSSILAGTNLIRQAIKSPNFLTGVSGWSINKDGSAEFNNVVIRGGSVLGGDILLYHGTPAAGTLFMSISQAGGTDPYGNIYGVGISLIDDVTTDSVVAQITAEFSQYGGGFWTRGFQAPTNIFSQLQGGLLRFNSMTSAANQDGSIQWIDTPADNSTEMILSSGRYRNTDTPAWIELHPVSSLRTRPLVKIKDNSSGAVDLSVSGLLTLGGVDQGLGIVGSASITAAGTTFAATETVLMSTGSITFTNNRAYRVSVWTLLSAAADNYALLRLRKGTTIAGTAYKNQIRVNNLQTSGSAAGISVSFIITNTSGADISTAVSLTGIQGSVAQTWTVTASATDVTTLHVEDVGLAADWPGNAIT